MAVDVRFANGETAIIQLQSVRFFAEIWYAGALRSLWARD